MSKPTVSVIGATGMVGKLISNALLVSLKEGKLQEVRILSTKSSDVVQEFKSKGAVPFIVDFKNVDTLVKAFTGADVVLSTLGTGAGVSESKAAILTALTRAKTKIYFASEWGTNHYTRCKNYKHELFESKKDHFQKAKAIAGLKVVGVMNGLIMEDSFGSWFGLDNKAEKWTLVGQGNTPLATTAGVDLGRFAAEAVLKVFKDPGSFPEIIEILSDMRSLREYAKVFDKVAGRETKLEFVPLKTMLEKYEKEKKFEILLQILFEEGGFNMPNPNGNALLNPGEKVWKLKKMEQYATETKGRPYST